ncbi:hypothetical protein P20480_3315 [Pseudoalteromonas sp. BSi20480]|nr:hypothetical protein P20480_3315 [Pseudoalteromonas sp. BSi20480]
MAMLQMCQMYPALLVQGQYQTLNQKTRCGRFKLNNRFLFKPAPL